MLALPAPPVDDPLQMAEERRVREQTSAGAGVHSSMARITKVELS